MLFKIHVFKIKNTVFNLKNKCKAAVCNTLFKHTIENFEKNPEKPTELVVGRLHFTQSLTPFLSQSTFCFGSQFISFLI